MAVPSAINPVLEAFLHVSHVVRRNVCDQVGLVGFRFLQHAHVMAHELVGQILEQDLPLSQGLGCLAVKAWRPQRRQVSASSLL